MFSYRKRRMKIGVLISSETHFAFSGFERIEAAGRGMGHHVTKLFERKLSFHETSNAFEVRYDGEPLPQFDVIIVRANFVEEPTLHQYAYDFLRRARYKLVNGDGVLRTKNKLLQRADLRTANIPMPKWGAAFDLKGVEEAVKTLGYPVILKTSFGTKGTGVFYVDKREALIPIVDYLVVRDGNPIIVEEFIEEAKYSHIRIFVVGGEIIAAMESFAPDGEVRSNARGSARVIELTEEEKSIAIKAAKTMNLEIAGVDLLRSKRGSLVMEVNSNPGFTELEKTTGVDVAKAIVEFSLK
jgi:ribosomal protein S6--L-glutamate ligase